MNLKVGLDLDGVIYNFQRPMDEFFLRTKKAPKLDNTEYSFIDRYGICNEVGKKYLDEFGKIDPFLWVPPFQDSLEFARKLIDKAEVYVITRRNWHPYGREQTYRRLIGDGLAISNDRLILTEEKGKVAKELGLDLFYEDSIINGKDIVDKSEAFVYLVNRPWNQGQLSQRMLRVNFGDIKTWD